MNPQEYWDRIAEKYDGLYVDAYSRFEDERVALHLLAAGLTPQVTVLELGCGTGLGARMATAMGCMSYTGLDISEAMIRIARNRYPNLKFEIGDLDQLPTTLRPADVVFGINGVGSYAKDLASLARAVASKTKPGGKIVMSFLHRWSLRRLFLLDFSRSEPLQTRGQLPAGDGSRQHVYGSRELKKQFTAAGFKDVRAISYGLFGGIYQTPLSAKIEQALPMLDCRLGHTIVVTGERAPC